LRFGSRGMWQKQARFWFATTVCAFLMMTPVSKPVWQLITTLQKVQFPFRFNTVLTLAVASLMAFGFSQLREHSKAFKAPVVTISILLCAFWIFRVGVQSHYSYPVHYRDEEAIEDANERLEVRRDTNEFRPRWVVSIDDDELATIRQWIGETNGEL